MYTMRKLFAILILQLAFLAIFPTTIFALTGYGDGKYGVGVYNVGENPTAGTSSCSDLVPSGTQPWLYQANATSSNSIILRFTNWQSPVDHFVLEYGTSSDKYSFGVANFGNKDTNSYTISSLSSNTTYYFRIRTGNGCAVGSWSNEISAKTFGSVSMNNLNIAESSITPVEEDKSPNCQTPYVVKSGNTLWLIAEKLLGNGSKFKNIIDENLDSYPSLEASDKLTIGWNLKIDCSKSTQKPSSAGSSQEKYKVNIKVLDTEQKPVLGAKVTMHSDPKETITDENGIAKFTDVEAGNHTVLIAYNNFQGEQSINLTGDVKEFNINVTIEPKNIFLDPRILIVVGVLILTIIFLILKLKKR